MAADAIRNGDNVVDVLMSLSGHAFCQYAKGLRDLHMLHTMSQQVAGPKRVVVHWGVTNTGKTRSAFEAGAASVEWTGSFLIGYKGQKIVLFDEFDWEKMDRSTFLKLTDRYPVTVNIKGGESTWCPDTIYLTCNFDPGNWYRSEEHGVDQAVQRRLTEIWFFEGEGIEPVKQK